MNFLDHLNDYIDINKYYKQLNQLDNIDYKNINNYINIQWTKIKHEIDDEYYSSININKIYSCDKLIFNSIMNKFINKNYTMGIFFINSFTRYI
jgi:hypothetical protein